MAYDPGPRQRPPPQWGYDDRSASRNERPIDHYGNGNQGYAGVNARGARQGTPQGRAGYSAQEEYDGYNQNPWSNDGESYNQNYDNHRNNHNEWGGQQDKYHRTEPPNGHMKQSARDYRDPRGPSRTSPDRRPPVHDQYGHENVNDRSMKYNNQPRPQEWQEQSFGYPDTSNNGHYNDYDGPTYRNEVEPAHSNSRMQDRTETSDQLPRYMNGHAHRFSNDESFPRASAEPRNVGGMQSQRERDGMLIAVNVSGVYRSNKL